MGNWVQCDLLLGSVGVKRKVALGVGGGPVVGVGIGDWGSDLIVTAYRSRKFVTPKPRGGFNVFFWSTQMLAI